MNTDSFFRFISSPTYANGGIIHTKKAHYPFRRWKIMTDLTTEKSYVDILDFFTAPIDIAKVEALTTTHPKVHDRLPSHKS